MRSPAWAMSTPRGRATHASSRSIFAFSPGSSAPGWPSFRRLRRGSDATSGARRDAAGAEVAEGRAESRPAAAAQTSRLVNRVREAVRRIPLEMAVRPIVVGGSSGRY
jgi:hypothetical protein